MLVDGVTIVDTTLREGEQFIHADFSTEEKLEIATRLSTFGIDYLELTSPAASDRSREDARQIVRAGLPATIAAHIRCHRYDAEIALGTGVDALHMVMAISPILRAASHGKSLDDVVAMASDVAAFARDRVPSIQLRFSSEDAFRCPIDDLLGVYSRLAGMGLFDRFGIADTTGAAPPDRVAETVRRVAVETQTPIEFHGHNDIGCAVANAHAALNSGASHINTSVLGIGERNGITPLEGLIAMLYSQDRLATLARYRLDTLPMLCQRVSEIVGVPIPFNQPLVGATAFSHKAGMHTKAVYNDPRAYEALDPVDFGLQRSIAIGHRLTGWNAVRVRSEALGLRLSLPELKVVTQRLKTAADAGDLTLDEVDALILAAAHDA
ncbi:MAG: homocitrate synthase [Alphaproteobacteria bacterium]|nr:homocitrate synthase [Alphaproteobacteria bacterium]